MKRTLQVVILGAALVLSACGAGNRQYYRPGDDPLVLAHFERLLNEHGIAYRRDIDGTYRPLQRARYDDLVAQGNRAREIGRGRESLEVTRGCALDRLRAFLDRNGYTYVRFTEAEALYLQMAESDFEDADVGARYAAFQAECAQEQEAQEQAQEQSGEGTP